LQERGRVKCHIKPASISAVQNALQVFKSRADIGDKAAAKMWLITLFSKFRGCRCSDILHLKWSQVKHVKEEIIVKPTQFKNMRFSGRWMFSIKIMPGIDNIKSALDLVKKNKKPVDENEYIFDKWKIGQVSYYFEKYKSTIGEHLTCHKIRVLTCLALTKLGWSDSSIKSFLHWRSSESLETYRAGFSVVELKHEKSLMNAYSSQIEGRLVEASVEEWREKFGS